jgi:type I restriction enzyme S subunit
MMLYRPDSSRLDSRYLVHALASRGVRSNLLRQIGGSTVGHARVDDIRDLAIPVPATKSEQEAIAGTLGDADALIESLEQLIAKKRLIKRGAMQELLRPKSHWHSHELEDVAEVIDPHPSHRAPPEVPDGIPFVGIGDLREDGEITGTRFRTVDPAVFDEHRRRYDLRDELIGLGRVASIGKVVRLQDRSEKYAVAPTLGIIRGTKVRRRYLLYALKSDATVEQFARIMSGSTRSSVGMNVLRTLLIYLPPTEVEQSQIAGVLSDIDADIDATQATLGELIKVKQGMMQQLLTGRIRLV